MEPLKLKDRKNLRILVTRTDRIGDLVLSVPAFEEIKKQFPDCYLAVLCLPATQAIVEGNSFVDEIISYDKRGGQRHWWQSFLFGFRLREKKFDVAIHLHPTNRVHLLSFLARIPIRIGYKRNFGFLLTHSIPEEKFQGEKHESEYNFDLLSLIDIQPPKEITLSYSLEEKDLLALDVVCKQANLSLDQSFIVIHPSASGPEKRWPLDRFSKLADILSEQYKAQIVFIGAEEKREVSSEVLRRMKREAIDLTGKLNLKQLGWLLKNTKLFISNDTGPVHIAVAVGVPVISLFGRTDPGLSPQRWRPLGNKGYYIHKPPSEIEIAKNPEKDIPCFENIQVGDILQLIENKRESFNLPLA